MPFQVCARQFCIGVLATIHRKRFYRNCILINLTLLLAYFSSIYSCLFLYNNVSKGKNKKIQVQYTSVFFFFCIIQIKNSGKLKKNHKITLCFSTVNALVMPYFHYCSRAWSFRLNKINKKQLIILFSLPEKAIAPLINRLIKICLSLHLKLIELKFKWQITCSFS